MVTLRLIEDLLRLFQTSLIIALMLVWNIRNKSSIGCSGTPAEPTFSYRVQLSVIQAVKSCLSPHRPIGDLFLFIETSLILVIILVWNIRNKSPTGRGGTPAEPTLCNSVRGDSIRVLHLNVVTRWGRSAAEMVRRLVPDVRNKSDDVIRLVPNIWNKSPDHLSDTIPALIFCNWACGVFIYTA